MNCLYIGSILITIICQIDSQKLPAQLKTFINNNHHKGIFNIFTTEDKSDLLYQDDNEIEFYESYEIENSKIHQSSPLDKIFNRFQLTKATNENENENENEKRRIAQGTAISTTTNLLPNLRLCERKYAEYIKRIFPHEKDTAADANDSQFNGRVLADPGEYPHMCALGFRNNMNGEFDYKCGGSLISDKFIITAAHCADLNGEKPSRVRIGAVDLKSNNTKPLIRNIKQVHVHPAYKTTSNYNDIALLEINKAIKLTEQIRPIRLWTSPTIAFKEAYAMGYGSTAFAREPTNCLTVLTMSIVPNVECDRKMPVLPETKYGIISGQICAQDFISNRDTCQGDSGGPLQLNLQGHRHHKRAHYHLIGITSYGLYCRSGYPSVFTRVQHYLDWIEQIVWL